MRYFRNKAGLLVPHGPDIQLPGPQLSGHFTIVKSLNGFETGRWEFRNLITNRGLDLIGLQNSVTNYIYLSTSTATPAVTDTAMGGTVVSISATSPVYTNSNTISGSSPYTASHLRGFRFAAGTATGTWSSIGIGAAESDSNNVFAKTRIRDGGGTPTSITVLAGETLDVRYELRTELTLTDWAGTVSGISYTARNFGATQNNSRQLGLLQPPGGYLVAANGSIALDTITSLNGFTNYALFSGYTGGTFSAYTLGNYYRDFSIVWPTTATHASNQVRGIQLYQGSNLFSYAVAILFATPVGKTNLQTATLTGRMSWGRAP